MVVEGEEVQASVTHDGADAAAHRGPQGRRHAGARPGRSRSAPTTRRPSWTARRARQGDPGELFIIDQLEVGMQRIAEPIIARSRYDEANGQLVPVLAGREVGQDHRAERVVHARRRSTSPWGRAIVPFEMLSVLANKAGRGFPVRGPSLGLFLDLEVRMLAGPVFVDEHYELDREIVGLSQSRRTESFWTETTITDAALGEPVAIVLLHQGVFKESYAEYPRDRLAGYLGALGLRSRPTAPRRSSETLRAQMVGGSGRERRRHRPPAPVPGAGGIRPRRRQRAVRLGAGRPPTGGCWPSWRTRSGPAT